ncbi:hypothetical protein [Burkholderia sp. RF4-BP95]|uniref:hypothetical protein n=1 Tax=Burkholderia sp. RF4-BP95 TaxID=1637845 RepID=UPI00075F25DD|nr:hypothetical protein [Burkholderia sp. RF4-BP95]KUY86209.1 hypothetical protein WS46_05005 [Burkholderia sp. RF4-BP95]
MNVYRGPSSKDFGDDTHQLVSSNELSKDMKPWSGHYMTSANLTKGVAPERQSIAHIGLSEADVLALYRALIDEKFRLFDALQHENINLKTKILRLENKITDLNVIAGVPGNTDKERVAKIRERLNKR